MVLFLGIALTACSGIGGTRDDASTSQVIQVFGANPFYVQEDQAYHDPGAIATDGWGEVTHLTYRGTVDTTHPGTYTITYLLDGQETNATRTVVVLKDHTKLRYTPVRYPANGLDNNEALVYYPKDAITPSMPVVVFLEGGGAGPHITDYSGIMAYLAAQGYYVIGAEQGSDYNASLGARIADRMITQAINDHGLEVDKLAVMGHSQGGGQAFYVMKHLQDAGYGSAASLVLSIDGWFAFSMDKADLEALQGRVTFLQMNGVDGTGTDPRINLTIWALAHNTERSYLTLPENDHSYVMGSLDNVTQNKHDLLNVVGALTDDAFAGSHTEYGYLEDRYKSSFDDVFNALKPYDTYSGDCAGEHYNAKSMLRYNDINYCTMGQ